MSKKSEVITSVESSQQVKLRNVLFATDFSTASEAALHYAVSIARRYDSQLFVAHVISPTSYGDIPIEGAAAAYQLTRQQAEHEMANLLISGRLRAVPHQVLLGEGAIWPVLSDMIRKNDIDLIVLGTHGRTGVRKVFLGSIAEEIFRRAECPVLTAGPRVTGTPEAETTFRQIVYATDFSPASQGAMAYALSLAQEHQARLALLHVVSDGAQPEAKRVTVPREFYTRKLRALVTPEMRQWIETDSMVEFGDPAEKTLGVARDWRADLIVLGAHPVAILPGHLPQTTAYKVVCQAWCPVLTVRS